MIDLSQARWEEYYGNNHKKIPSPDVVAGGCVSFTKHIGKQLSQWLWEDLVHRLCINGLCIYKPDQSRWCVGWGQGHCIISLDEERFVSDIEFFPHKSHLFQ